MGSWWFGWACLECRRIRKVVESEIWSKGCRVSNRSLIARVISIVWSRSSCLFDGPKARHLAFTLWCSHVPGYCLARIDVP